MIEITLLPRFPEEHTLITRPPSPGAVPHLRKHELDFLTNPISTKAKFRRLPRIWRVGGEKGGGGEEGGGQGGGGGQPG